MGRRFPHRGMRSFAKPALGAAILSALAVLSCYAPDPRDHSKTIDTAPIPVGESSYEVRQFTIDAWRLRKNFALAGQDGLMIVAGGENGLKAELFSFIARFDVRTSSFSVVEIPTAANLAGRSFLPAAGVSFSSSGFNSLSLMGGANFVEITKEKGVRSDLWTSLSADGSILSSRSLSSEGLAPRSMSCVAGLPGGDYFTFGGENMGSALSSGAIITSGDVIIPLPGAEAPEARFGHACAYNPSDGLVYVLGGYTDLGVATSVYAFDRSAWRWTFVGSLPAVKSGFFYYALLGRGLVTVGESLVSSALEAHLVASSRVTPLVLKGPAVRDPSRALPYWAGEASGPRPTGSFVGDCLVLPVTGGGGLPRLREYCLRHGDTLEETTELDGIAADIPAGVFAIPGSGYSIYVGAKSVYSDPLTSGQGLILIKTR